MTPRVDNSSSLFNPDIFYLILALTLTKEPVKIKVEE